MFLSVASQRTAETVAGQITLSLARSRMELEEAFALLYRSYLRAGLDVPNASEMRLTPYHLLSTTEVFQAKLSGVTISTASLMLNGPLGLPADSIYGNEIQELQERGLRVAEVGCFADRRASPVRFIQMFRQLSTLIAQAAAFRGCNGLIAATHPRHARFYIRNLGFEQFGEIRDCPYAEGNPAVALLLDFEKQKGTEVHEHLFGKKYTPRELKPFQWDDDTTQYFSSILTKIRAQTTGHGVPVVVAGSSGGSIQPLADQTETS